MLINFRDFFNLDYWRELLSFDIFSWSFLVNVLDVIVVWYLVYKLIQLVRGTKAIQLFKGVGLFIVLRFLAGIVGLKTLSWLMDQVITYGVIAAIVIFQPEIRRGLEHLGRSSFFKTSKNEKRRDEVLVQALDKAVQYMAKRKIGALITIERTTGLEEYIETGIPLDADVTGELLINIFIPNTPLHDGAVILRDDKIAVASAYLPLSESPLIPKEFGTRHRAAVGISEVSDALTIIVSEETGAVSITLNNRMLTELSRQEYLDVLNRELVPEEKPGKRNLLQSFFEGVNKGGRNDQERTSSKRILWYTSAVL